MIHSATRLILGFCVSILMLVPAWADVCRSIAVELASLQPAQAERNLAQQAASEMNRLGAHMRSIGCDRQSFLMFGQPAPPECGSYRARMGQLQAQASAGQSSEGRRRHLLSMMISYNCRSSSRAPLTAGLFDDGSRRSSLEIRSNTPIDPEPAPRIESRIRSVGGKAVCVRLCDGFYFPLDQRQGNLRETGDETCQSLCPATETKAYLKPGDIETARSIEGENYTALPNAFRYRKTFDASCTCREQGETLGSQLPRILNPEEGSGGAAFSVLNQDQADLTEDLALRGPSTDSIPAKPDRKTGRDKKSSGVFGKAKVPEPPSPPQPAPEIPADRLVAAGVGDIREYSAGNGLKRKVRVIGPEHVGVPAAATAPSVQDHDPDR